MSLYLIITPEGTRSANPNWKRGFHHVATKAEVPILVVSVDSTKRVIAIEGLMEPSDDVAAEYTQAEATF